MVAGWRTMQVLTTLLHFTPVHRLLQLGTTLCTPSLTTQRRGPLVLHVVNNSMCSGGPQPATTAHFCDCGIACTCGQEVNT